MDRLGLNQSTLSTRLDVSREAVSKWFKDESFPKPDKLLRLATILDLGFGELVEKSEVHAPVVAFRKARASKTTDAHYARAQTMGRMLRNLVDYLPFDKIVSPPVLKNPNSDYSYLQEVSLKVRSDIGIGKNDRIEYYHLIEYFKTLQAVLIPVLWGSKNRHENATHIFLPDSRTTWVYLNLDTNALDFNFWMSHELGHCLAPDLRGEEAEDFADAFAGALLFPHELSESTYERVIQKSSIGAQINEIRRTALEFAIAPYSVHCQLNAYALHVGRTKLDLSIHAAAANVNKELPLISKMLLGDEDHPEADSYISAVNDNFKTPFFNTLKDYLKVSEKGPGFIQTLMDVPTLDARSIHSELV